MQLLYLCLSPNYQSVSQTKIWLTQTGNYLASGVAAGAAASAGGVAAGASGVAGAVSPGSAAGGFDGAGGAALPQPTRPAANNANSPNFFILSLLNSRPNVSLAHQSNSWRVPLLKSQHFTALFHQQEKIWFAWNPKIFCHSIFCLVRPLLGELTRFKVVKLMRHELLGLLFGDRRANERID